MREGVIGGDDDTPIERDIIQRRLCHGVLRKEVGVIALELRAEAREQLIAQRAPRPGSGPSLRRGDRLDLRLDRSRLHHRLRVRHRSLLNFKSGAAS
jgi:hypothetical protein